MADSLILDKFYLQEKEGHARCDSCRDWCEKIIEIVDRNDTSRFDRICRDCLCSYFFDDEEYFFGEN